MTKRMLSKGLYYPNEPSCASLSFAKEVTLLVSEHNQGSAAVVKEICGAFKYGVTTAPISENSVDGLSPHRRNSSNSRNSNNLSVLHDKLSVFSAARARV